MDSISHPESNRYNLSPVGEKEFFIAIEKSLNTPVYRYLKKSYYDDFLQTGRIRLSTLWSCHDEVNLGMEQGDKNEGFRSFHSRRDGFQPNNIPTVFYADSVNQWALCATKIQDEQFYSDFDADCCIEISSLSFFLEICAAARRSADIGLVCSVQYVDTRDLVQSCVDARINGVPWKPPFFPITKDARFSWQSEVRLLLEPPRKGVLWNYDDMSADVKEEYISKIQRAMLSGNDHVILERSELHYDLQPLFVEAPQAIQYTRIIETK